MSLLQTDISEKLRLNPITAAALTDFARRRAWLLTLRTIAIGLIAFVASMMVVATCDHLWLLPEATRWGLSLFAYGATLAVIWWFGWRRADRNDVRRIARQIETADPRFNEQLLSTVELSDPESTNGSDRFRQWLQDQTARRIAGIDVGGLLPLDLIRPWIATAAVVLAVTGLLLLAPRVQFGRRLARAILPGAAIERASLTKIQISKPSPPSDTVAQGDAVGVVAAISGPNADDARLQWRTDSGTIDELPMSPQRGGGSTNGIYSAILAMGDVPIEYRILAGDGITLWHRLTPIPRPRAQTFLKQYVFPDYAQIPDLTSEDEHGDLQAIKGTVAHVTVRFNEPCSEAAVRFIGGPLTLPMKPTDQSQKIFSIAIPISERARYQLTATSLHTGLENPPGHQYEVVPITDSPPVVAWGESVESQQIVSAADVVPLHVQITDELPIDDVVQEYQVNNAPVQRRTLTVPDAGRQLDLRFEWDLMDLKSNDESELAGGDIVHTRIAVQDRRGQRSESSPLLLLIADDGFAPTRHERMDRLHELAKKIIGWSQQTGSRLRELSELEPRQLTSDETNSIDLQSPAEIRTLLARLIESAENPVAAGRLELTGSAISDLDRKIQDWQAELRTASSATDNGWGPDQNEMMVRLKSTPLRLSDECTNIDNYVRNHLSHRLSIGLIDDATTLQRSLTKLLESDIPADRFSRHLQIVDGRLKEIDQRFAKHQDSLVDSSRRLSDAWSQWRQRYSETIKRAIDEQFPVAPQRSILEQLKNELQSHQADKSIFNQQSSVGLINATKTLRNQIGDVADTLHDLSNAGSKLAETEAKMKDANDSGDTATLTGEARFYSSRFDTKRNLLLNRLDDTRDLHSVSPNSDLPFLADLGLLNSAVANVTEDGFVDYNSEPAKQVFTNLAEAFLILEAGHEVTQWRNELRGLIAAETARSDGARARYEHPQWLDRYTAGVATSLEKLRRSTIDPGARPKIIHSTTDPNIVRAKQLLEPRRYDREQSASAKRSLTAVERELSEYLDRLQAVLQAARDVIRRYVVPLHEQAREAARQVQEALDQSESESVNQELAEADEATEKTMRALGDLANIQSTDQREGRELARDADAALAQISQKRDLVNDAKRNQSPEQLKDGLDQLRQRLEQTADHFERAEQGEDVTESRQKLRDGEKELQIDQQLDERYRKAEALAEASQMDAEELRKQLEQEAARNEAMRDELSDIARRTAESALDSLRQSAQDESDLNQAMERSDPDFAEQTQHLSERVAELAQQLSSLEQIYGNAATDSAKAASPSDGTENLQQAWKQIRAAAETTQQPSTKNNTHSSIIRNAANMIDKVDAAFASVENFTQSIQNSEAKKLDDNQRGKQRVAAERRLQNVRNQRLRYLNQSKARWNAALRNATGRVQQAKQQIGSNENVIERLRESAEQAPQDDGLKQQISNVQQRVDQAKRFESAANATVDAIESKLEETEKALNHIKAQKISLSDSEMPNLDAAELLGSQLGKELAHVLGELQEISGQSDLPEELDVPEFAAEQLVPQQQRIRDEIDETGNELRRAALNEQRLGRNDGARKLADSATRVKRLADREGSSAVAALDRMRSEPEAASDAHRQVQRTLDGIDREANELAKLLGAISTETGDAQRQASEQAQQQAKQLAQTLDELDQASAEQGDSPSDQTAGEASPTLDQAKQQSARQAAQQRQKQMNSKPGEAGDQSKDSSTSLSGMDGETRSGDTTMPEGGPVSIDGIDRIGKDWGYLRARRPGDSSDQPRTRIPAKYRQQIEAYFRAIAERSAGGEQ